MENISEYDERQLRIMLQNLISFEKDQIELSSLVGGLEFLFYALETVNVEWEEKFLKEITTLESINSIEIIKNAGEKVSVLNINKKNELIKKSILSIKTLIEKKSKN